MTEKVVNLSADADNVTLDSLVPMMSGGHIEILTSEAELLAKLPLSNPAAQQAVDGEIAFNPIGEGQVVRTGEAKVGRIVGPTGSEILNCSVGDENSDAVIKLSTTTIHVGTVVRLNSFRLRMP